MEKKELKNKINKLWKQSKKELDKILKDTQRLAKKGEVRLIEASQKAENNLEAMVLSLQKEKLYYELGKSLAKISKKNWKSSKKVEKMLNKIKEKKRKIRAVKNR